MKLLRYSLISFLAIFGLVFVVACGGGGGSSNPAPAPAPTTFAKVDLDGKTLTVTAFSGATNTFVGSIVLRANGTYDITTTSGPSPDDTSNSTLASSGTWTFNVATQQITFSPSGGGSPVVVTVVRTPAGANSGTIEWTSGKISAPVKSNFSF
jgi:hypothetical protein